MNKIKKVTHVFAVGLGLVVGFVGSPAGQGVLRQYPKLSVGASVLLAVAAALGVYHQPNAN